MTREPGYDSWLNFHPTSLNGAFLLYSSFRSAKDENIWDLAREILGYVDKRYIFLSVPNVRV